MLNLTFGISLVLILFVLPGALFRKTYNTSLLSNYHKKASTFSEIVITLALGLLLQAMGVLSVKFLSSKYSFINPVDFKILGELVTVPTQQTFIVIEKYFKQIFYYQLTICAISTIMGRITLLFIVVTELDKKFLMLRFDNDWHYILSGTYFKTKTENKIVKYANILINIDDEFIIYSGFISNYTKDNDGKLELVELYNVKRKLITKGEIVMSKTKEQIFNVDKLFIPYCNILNFSITYYGLDEVKSSNNNIKKFFEKITPSFLKKKKVLDNIL